MVDRPNVIVVASAMVDMTCYLDRAPVAGETVVGNDFALGFGGKGANQAVMAGRLGCQVWLTACLGDDVFADMAFDHYRREGLDLQHVHRVAGTSSGVAPIWVDATGENRIVVVPGANSHLSPAHVTAAVTGATDVDVVLSQMEVPQETTLAAFEAARSRGAATILNPAPARTPIDGLLDLCDWVIVNETEFANLFPGSPAEGATPRDDDLLAAASTMKGRLVAHPRGRRCSGGGGLSGSARTGSGRAPGRRHDRRGGRLRGRLHLHDRRRTRGRPSRPAGMRVRSHQRHPKRAPSHRSRTRAKRPGCSAATL